MNYGFQAMATLPFLSVGFAFVCIGALGFGITFALGPARGGHAALKFKRVWTAVIIGALAFVALWAWFTGQLPLFLESYGFAPLLEMLVLASGWILIMGFMATQYAVGRITLDEKFGGSKERRKEAIEQAKVVQHEKYDEAHSKLGSSE